MMFAKLTAILFVCGFIAAILLVQRHHRLMLMHETIELHTQINRDRQATWNLQVQINQQLTPAKLYEAIEHRQLELVPIHPFEPGESHRMVGLTHD